MEKNGLERNKAFKPMVHQVKKYNRKEWIQRIKTQIIEAGRKAVRQLIKVAKEEIIKPDPEDELAADRLKNEQQQKS